MKKTSFRIEEPRPPYLRPVSSTIGRIGGTLGLLPLLHPEIPFKRHTPERRKELENVANLYRKLLGEKEDTKSPDDLAVYLGAQRPLDQLKKMWQRKEISVPSKLLGTIGLPASAAMGALFRSDHYNPFSRTVTLYNPEPGILAHELGHDVDFSRRSNKLLHMLAYNSVPGAPLYYEAVATRIASKVLQDNLQKATELNERGKLTDEDLKKLTKQFKRSGSILSPAYGTYVANELLKLGVPAAQVIPPVMRFIKPKELVAPTDEYLEDKIERIKKIRARFNNQSTNTYDNLKKLLKVTI